MSLESPIAAGRKSQPDIWGRKPDLFDVWARFPDKLAELWKADAAKTRKKLRSPTANFWLHPRPGPPVPKSPPYVVKRRKDILAAINDNPGVSRVQIKETLGIGEDAMRNDLHMLMAQGVIRKERRDRYSFYYPVSA